MSRSVSTDYDKLRRDYTAWLGRLSGQEAPEREADDERNPDD